MSKPQRLIEWYDGGNKTKSRGDFLSIHGGGVLYFSSSIIEKLGSPRFVKIGFDLPNNYIYVERTDVTDSLAIKLAIYNGSYKISDAELIEKIKGMYGKDVRRIPLIQEFTNGIMFGKEE